MLLSLEIDMEMMNFKRNFHIAVPAIVDNRNEINPERAQASLQPYPLQQNVSHASTFCNVKTRLQLAAD